MLPNHADGWVALWTFTLTLATLLLAWMVYWQVGKLREEGKQARTVAACERYDLDPQLFLAIQKLEAAVRAKRIKKNPVKYRSDMIFVLNYLEQLAMGCNCDVYDEGLLKTFMREPFEGHVESLIDSGAAKKAKIISGDGTNTFQAMLTLHKKWQTE